MTVINLEENLMGFDRYNGGWVKTITSLDKDYQNGYSLNGDFVANKRVKNVDLQENVLYLDCSIGGSRKNPEKNYHLFKFESGEIEIIKTIEDGQNDWAVQLWDDVERELGLQKTKPQQCLEDVKKLKADEFIEFMIELSKEKNYQMYISNVLIQNGIDHEKVLNIIQNQ